MVKSNTSNDRQDELLTPKQVKIAELLNKLSTMGPSDPSKKGIRSQLRRLGHTGGLRSITLNLPTSC